MKPRSILPGLFALCVLAFPHAGLHGAPAEVLVDPTRPPSFAAGEAGSEKSVQARVVQSVLIAPGRTIAVVNGETLRVGSRVGGTKVVKIDQTGVTLSNSGKLEVLRLFPDAQKSEPVRVRR